MTQIIALAGSLRSQSYNKNLVKIAAKGAEEQGAHVVYVDLADYPIPLFSEDLEAEGTPAAVNDLKHLFAKSQGILLASPEYNGSISGVLKNVIDWLSRPSQGADVGSAFNGKVAGIMAASPGGLGGLRGLGHVRDILNNLGAVVNPTQVAVPAAYGVFNEQGVLLDEDLAQRVKALGAQVADMASRLND
ncbi:FMN reductase [Gammaproteobacteria bacterium 42_54_T18]|nr:FMN reductase [Gammaproteobacteria bacterium 42_54_T18]